MTDFNQLFEELADAIADKVVARLASQQGTNWPAVETKVDSITVNNPPATTQEVFVEKPELEVKPFVRTVDKLNVKPEVVSESSGPGPGDRIEELSKVNVRTLRRQAAAVGVLNDSHDLGDYEGLEKDALITEIVNFEMLTGKTLYEHVNPGVKKAEKVATETEEFPDDTDLETPETPDEEEGEELTREIALTLDTQTLKSYAIDNDIDASKLVGLDVEELVKLLFGPEEVEEEPAEEVFEGASSVTQGEDESDEEGGWTEEGIRAASRSELKDFVAQLNDQLDDASQIGYDRNTSDEDLAQIIIDLVI